MKSINPSTNLLICEYPEHSPEQVREIICSAEQDWQSWKNLDFSVRASLMRNLSALLLEKKEELADLITQEMGKISSEALTEIDKCSRICLYYAENTENLLKDELVTTRYKKSYTTFQPLGLILAVMPWNFPFWQVIRCMAPALMSGNGGILKHATNVSGCALELEKLFREAGFPKNIFRTLLVPNEGVAEIIAHKAIKAVTLTGSERAGSAVAQFSGKMLKKTILELGGSDPFIVLEDANIEKAVDAAIRSRMYNTGQACTAAKRFVIVEKVATEFLRKLKSGMEALIIGNPSQESTQVGPLARPDLLKNLDSQVKRSLEQGADLLLGGVALETRGNFYPPTILTNVTEDMPVFKEETFGPVSAVIVVKNEAEAIRVANASEYGLSCSLWTEDTERGERIAHQIESGSVYINCATSSVPQLPFGGIKRSGYGRELSAYGLKEFLNIRSICIDQDSL
ncbi:MAG: succinate-semialdehyde dehydrogenase [SAR324 cluster bacterium]|uniref:Succinate-semialdehyde dehydrogenase n=1 Tax=SAR324 cluster bacterium TaxID=2024889 RepID=A0A2A4TAF3_9DELT|nr:MAG: succinate-semialdehyde dehydrogenase [SAR324 cluster bacterium]